MRPGCHRLTAAAAAGLLDGVGQAEGPASLEVLLLLLCAAAVAVDCGGGFVASDGGSLRPARC